MFEYGHWVSEVERPESSKAFVYIIKLDIDGVEKLYIGYKTIRGNRWMGYKTSSKVVKPLWENVVEAKIVEWFDNETDALLKEIEMLKEVDAAFNDAYLNLCNGNARFNTTGMRFSEDHRNLLSQKKMGHTLSPEHKEKLLSAAKDARGEECYKKVSEKLKGQTLSDDHKNKLRQAKLGSIQTADTVSKRAEKNKKKIEYDNTIFYGIKETAFRLGIPICRFRKSLNEGILNGKPIKLLKR